MGPKELWEKTGRWSSMGSELLQLTDRNGSEFCLQVSSYFISNPFFIQPTAEEMCTQLVGQLPQLKRSALPLMLYQTTEKFRDEMNPRQRLLSIILPLISDLVYSVDVSF